MLFNLFTYIKLLLITKLIWPYFSEIEVIEWLKSCILESFTAPFNNSSDLLKVSKELSAFIE